MSTMEPEDIDGGRRIEGNSILERVSHAGQGRHAIPYQALVFGKKDRHSCVDLTNSQRDQHRNEAATIDMKQVRGDKVAQMQE